MRQHGFLCTVLLLATIITVAAFGQIPRRGKQAPRKRPSLLQKSKGKGEKGEEPKPPPLPTDKRLLTLHQRFVQDAVKLAAEYETGQDWDKAKSVYGEILKLVPKYPLAEAKMKVLLQREANAAAKQMSIAASKDWQDTGVELIPGKPVLVRAIGKWTFNLSIPVGPEGVQIPKELREYNMGCLIGLLRSANGDTESFVVGAEKTIRVTQPSKLYLKMYDTKVDDNEGELKVEVRGTFKMARR